jgi:mannose-6-phosphate isomerase-like protein (cupin superfamily)
MNTGSKKLQREVGSTFCGAQAPAHSHDHYEETIWGIEGVSTWTVDGKQIDVGQDRHYAFRAVPFTGSITMESTT